MLAWLLAFGIGGFGPSGHNGMPVAPGDIHVGRQDIELRQPLHAKSPGARLILFVRNTGIADPGETDRIAELRAAVPPGSVVAHLNGPDTGPVTLQQSGYTWHRGRPGIVLGDSSGGPYRTAYSALQIESAVALTDVRFVWLSRGGKRVEDLAR